MLEIPCPWCGDRAQTEFSYLGDASRARPADLDGCKLDAWFDFVYLRGNPRGPHREYWQHTAGCRQFVKVLRNTATHEILATALPGEMLDDGRPEQLTESPDPTPRR